MISINDVYEPKCFDILLMDICSKDLRETIPKKLNIEYLSDSLQEFNDDINGIMYGSKFRLFCATTVKIKNKIKVIHFLVDTGSPMTYICEEVLNAFGVSLADPDQFISVRINNRQASIMMSPTGSHFKEVNVIGMEFMKLFDAELHVYFSKSCFSLKFDQEEVV